MNAFVFTLQKWEKELEMGNQAHMPFLEQQDDSRNTIEAKLAPVKTRHWTFEWKRQQKARPAASCDCPQS